MLIGAKYKDDKIMAFHAENVANQMRYCQDLAKDQSNGFTKDRLGRRLGSFPYLLLLDYDKKHPGWLNRISVTKDFEDKQKAWREFLEDESAKPFLMVEKLKH